MDDIAGLPIACKDDQSYIFVNGMWLAVLIGKFKGLNHGARGTDIVGSPCRVGENQQDSYRISHNRLHSPAMLSFRPAHVVISTEGEKS